MTKHAVIGGFALAAAVVIGSLALAAGQAPRGAAADSFPAAQCSPPPDEEAERVRHLDASLEQTRAAAERNPLLIADVAYYQAELAASRGRPQSVTAR
jgi:hypothetical protein